MPDSRFPHYQDFRDWCNEHISDIIERHPQIDESIEVEDMEVDNVYILNHRERRRNVRFPDSFYLVYIFSAPSGGREWIGYHWIRINRRLQWGQVITSSSAGTTNAVGGRLAESYFIIPVSSIKFSFINWSDDPFTVK